MSCKKYLTVKELEAALEDALDNLERDEETLASKRQGPPTTKQDSDISDVPDREGEQSDSSDEETNLFPIMLITCHNGQEEKLSTRTAQWIMRRIRNIYKENYLAKLLWKFFACSLMMRENILQTGGGGYKCTDLNELENRLISIYGWVHIVGCPGAPDEVDPDNNGKSRTPHPITHKRNFIGICNNDEIIHIEVEADNFPPSSAETVNMPLCSSTQRKTGAVRKVPVLKKRTVQNGTTKLEKAAQSYSQSTEQMALAVREMAKAISELAKA
ncbi:hypothetical protein JTB14_034157 [Gonioctena quinquepunctata]|nr:hypothetical protein JTB14_034157 [Gonioctena quinquepunctata]